MEGKQKRKSINRMALNINLSIVENQRVKLMKQKKVKTQFVLIPFLSGP